jgi:hypothetical protein
MEEPIGRSTRLFNELEEQLNKCQNTPTSRLPIIGETEKLQATSTVAKKSQLIY